MDLKLCLTLAIVVTNIQHISVTITQHINVTNTQHTVAYPQPCNASWVHGAALCYRRFVAPTYMLDAHDFCVDNHGADLALPLNEFQNNHVKNLYVTNPIWINILKTGGNWFKHIENGSDVPITWDNFGSGVKDDPIQLCAVLESTGAWSPSYCITQDPRDLVCERGTNPGWTTAATTTPATTRSPVQQCPANMNGHADSNKWIAVTIAFLCQFLVTGVTVAGLVYCTWTEGGSFRLSMLDDAAGEPRNIVSAWLDGCHERIAVVSTHGKQRDSNKDNQGENSIEKPDQKIRHESGDESEKTGTSQSGGSSSRKRAEVKVQSPRQSLKGSTVSDKSSFKTTKSGKSSRSSGFFYASVFEEKNGEQQRERHISDEEVENVLRLMTEKKKEKENKNQH